MSLFVVKIGICWLTSYCTDCIIVHWTYFIYEIDPPLLFYLGYRVNWAQSRQGAKGNANLRFYLLSFPLQFSSISLCVCYVVQFVVAQHFNVILSTCNKKHNKISITTRAEVTTTTIVASTWTCVKQTLHLLLHYESCFSKVSRGGGGGRAESLAKHYAPSQVQCLPQSLT